MVKPCVKALAFSLFHMTCTAGTAHGSDPDAYPAWRVAAARALAARGDARSLATAAALTFMASPGRTKADSARSAAALDLIVAASDLAPDNPAISWLRLRLCTFAPGCDVRDAATTMRWVAADNGAAWLPTLAAAQRDKDAVEIDRVLAAMAEGAQFDLYANRAAVLMFDALKSARTRLPANYLRSDLARLTEAKGIADAAVLPSFSPLINACREAAAGPDRRADCLTLSKKMEHADTVMAQLVGFAVEKRLTPTDSKDARVIAERRRLLEWRVAAANQSDEPLLPWLRNARARWYVAKMRLLPREEDVCIAWLREHKMPLEPQEDHR